ncbi:MAG: metal ABC transporter substrate-binding protein [Promethearchaeota archaeon]
MEEIKKNLPVIFILFLLMGSFGLNIGQVNKRITYSLISLKEANTSLNIVATITIIEDAVKHVIGQDVPVVVPGSADPHSYEPTSDEILALENADIIFRMGIEDLEPWWRNEWEDAYIVKLIDPNMLKIDPLLGFVNPHIWMDPNNMKNFTQEINQTLWTKEPLISNKWIFSNNTLNYLTILDELLDTIQNARAIYNATKLVVNHPAYFYLFQENLLNLTRLATIEKGEAQEPSAKEIAYVIRIMREEGCHLIVTDPQHRTENVYEIARETKSKIALLTPLLDVKVDWNGEQVLISNYTQMIEYNIWALGNPINPPSLFSIIWIIIPSGIILIALLISFLYIRRRESS